MKPYDEHDISDDDIIIRRVSPKEHIVSDQNTGRRRLSSKAFKASSGAEGGMSVDIKKLIDRAGVDAHTFVTTPVFTGSVSFLASQIRGLALWIGYEPVQGNAYHGEVWRNPNGGKFSNGQVTGLQSSAVWFVPIENVDLK